MDQNEKLAKWKIMSFAAVDGFSRFIIHHEVTVCLTGPRHSEFFSNAIELHGMVPHAVSVDHTGK